MEIDDSKKCSARVFAVFTVTWTSLGVNNYLHNY